MSEIILKPSLNDESINYSCRAKHEALQGKPALFSTVQLSVLCKISSAHFPVLFFEGCFYFSSYLHYLALVF